MSRKPKGRADGEGSVYQDGEGWRAQLVIDGKMHRRRAATKREAYTKLKELEAIRDARLNVGDGKQTVAQWLTHWLANILPPVVKERTLETHTGVVRRYILPHLGRYTLLRLNAQHIDEWMTALRKDGLSDGTILNARRRLSAALEEARRRKLIPENPVALTKAPAAPPRVANVLDEAQIRTFLHANRDHRLYTLYALAVATGMRQAELFGLRWASVDLAAGTLAVEAQIQWVKLDGDDKRRISNDSTVKGKKTEAAKRRVLYLSDDLVQTLTAHRHRQRQERLIHGAAYQGGDLVFTTEAGTPLDRGGMLRLFKRALKRADLPDVTFHSLRHSAGSIMLAHGAQLIDVSHVLGHASVTTTAKIYAHSFTEGQRRAVASAASALLRSA